MTLYQRAADLSRNGRLTPVCRDPCCGSEHGRLLIRLEIRHDCREIRSRCEVRVGVEVLAPGTLPKTEFKAKRVRDEREK